MRSFFIMLARCDSTVRLLMSRWTPISSLVLKEALGHLPVGVAKVMLRSDTAGYQQELLRYCAEGRDERFGVIEFAVGVSVSSENVSLYVQ